MRRRARRAAGRTEVLESPPHSGAAAPTAPTADSIPQATRPAAHATALRGHIYACAALAALGTGTGLPLLLDEFAWHCTSGRAAGCLVGIAAGLGVLMGLWLPRQLLRPRLEADLGAAGGRGTVELAFAAALTGGLLLLLALLWTLLQVGGGWLEAYRAALVARVLLPAGPGHVLLLGPLLAGIAALGLLSTLVLVALQGWHGLVSGPRPPTAQLMVVLVSAITAGAALGSSVPSPSAVRFISLLFAYLAGVIAVAWPVRGTGSSGPPAVPVGRREIAGPLLWAGLAGLLASGALVLTLGEPGSFPEKAHAATVCAAAGSAALLGMIAANGWLRAGRSAIAAMPMCIFLAAFALMLPVSDRTVLGLPGGAWRLMLVAGPAAACLFLVTRVLVRAFQRPQPATARIGGALAAGMVIGCAAAGPWASAVPAYRVSLLMAALCITAASCPWIAGRNGVPRMRGAAVLIAATAIAGVMWQWPPDTGSGPERAAPAEAAPLWSHLVKQRPESACLAMQSSRGVFDHDWGGARYDALLLYGDAPGAEAARRSLWRATSSVRPCGYLALSLPAEHLAPAAFRQSRGRALHLVTLHRAGERWTALVLGPDPGAWLERWVPDEYVYEVRPVDSLAAMRGAITE